MIPVEAVVFAIRAGLRLAEEGRQIYIASTLGRELVLPLPEGIGVDVGSAFNFFLGDGKQHCQPGSRLRAVFDRVGASSAANPAPDTDRRLLLNRYREILACQRAERAGEAELQLEDKSRMPAKQVLAVLTVRQWEMSEEEAFEKRVLCRVAGTVIDLAVDYFAGVPGALNENAKQGRVLRAVVSALDQVEFASIDPTMDGWLKELAQRLLLAALETVGEQAEHLGNDPRVHVLIQVATEGLIKDLGTRFQDPKLSEHARGRLGYWGEQVFRSLLNSAGRKVLSEPDVYLGLRGQARGVLVQRVGTSLIDLALDQDLDLQRMFGREGLEQVARAALGAVAEHPDVLGLDHAGLTGLLGAVARLVNQQSKLLSLDSAPAVMRIVLEMTGENLDQLWPEAVGDRDPSKHLLVTALGTTLKILATEPPNGAPWKLRFTSGDALLVAESVLREVAGNPGWLLAGAGKIDQNLEAALAAALSVLRRRGDEKLLSRDTATALLRETLNAAVQRQEFLERLPGSTQTIIGQVLELATTAIFALNPSDPGQARAAWQLLRTEAITTAVHVTLQAASKSRLDPETLPVIEAFWTEQIARLNEGHRLDWVEFREGLESRLPQAA